MSFIAIILGWLVIFLLTLIPSIIVIDGDLLKRLNFKREVIKLTTSLATILTAFIVAIWYL